MALENKFDDLNPERYRKYQIKGFIGREQLAILYDVGRTALTNRLKEVEPYIKEVLPHFKIKNRKHFTVREQELIFHYLGPPPGYEI